MQIYFTIYVNIFCAKWSAIDWDSVSKRFWFKVGAIKGRAFVPLV